MACDSTACECICELDKKKPIILDIRAGKPGTLGIGFAMVTYKVNFSKAPACKQKDCDTDCKIKWKCNWKVTPKDPAKDTVSGSIPHTPPDEHDTTFQVIGNGRFTVEVTVNVTCVCLEDADDGVETGEVCECSDHASREFILRPPI